MPSEVDQAVNAFGRLAEAVDQLVDDVTRILVRLDLGDAAVYLEAQRRGIDVAFRDVRLHLHVDRAFLHRDFGRFALHQRDGLVQQL